MLPAMRAILLELKPVWIVAAIFLGRIVPFFAFAALKGDHRSDIFLF
jgi:hypothetical protein